ncbi:hypothetical protein ACFFH4_10305 [Halalkalibacter alkalisediminis]|uniref:Uncharacterized protein n=1 Tax=Halalkalibacter alkalisediminis TaxID=935616 RepID=A0ABV6NFA1_9BACI
MMKKFILFLFILILVSCGQENVADVLNPATDTTDPTVTKEGTVSEALNFTFFALDVTYANHLS